MSPYHWVIQYIKHTTDSIRKQLNQYDADLACIDIVLKCGEGTNFWLDILHAAVLMITVDTLNESDSFLLSFGVSVASLLVRPSQAITALPPINGETE